MTCAPTLARLCRLLTKSPALETAPKPAPQVADAGPDRIGAGSGAGSAPRVNAPAARPSPPLGELIARLSALHPKRIDLGLERMHRLLERLDHPERKLPPVIHVAGTNGKGSTIAYLRAILEAAGLRVHVYTSPYLVRINECFRLGRAGGGVLVGDDELRGALEHCERANAGAPITIFEIETAAAFCLFAQHPADVRAAGSRPRRPARCHQCDRRAARDRDRADQHGSHRISRRHADGDRRREGRHHQARRAGDLRRAGAGGDGRDRAAGEAHARAAACRRRSNGMSMSSADGWSIRTIAA